MVLVLGSSSTKHRASLLRSWSLTLAFLAPFLCNGCRGSRRSDRDRDRDRDRRDRDRDRDRGRRVTRNDSIAYDTIRYVAGVPLRSSVSALFGTCHEVVLVFAYAAGQGRAAALRRTESNLAIFVPLFSQRFSSCVNLLIPAFAQAS